MSLREKKMIGIVSVLTLAGLLAVAVNLFMQPPGGCGYPSVRDQEERLAKEVYERKKGDILYIKIGIRALYDCLREGDVKLSRDEHQMLSRAKKELGSILKNVESQLEKKIDEVLEEVDKELKKRGL